MNLNMKAKGKAQAKGTKGKAAELDGIPANATLSIMYYKNNNSYAVLLYQCKYVVLQIHRNIDP